MAQWETTCTSLGNIEDGFHPDNDTINRDGLRKDMVSPLKILKKCSNINKGNIF